MTGLAVSETERAEHGKTTCWGNHDIGEEGLAWALARSPAPETLTALVSRAREHFGWFSKQVSRAFEYPWVIDQLGCLPETTVLDVGAGISPLPLLLAELGAKVITVDHSPTQRVLEQNAREWTGWGFFDYAVLHPHIKSQNNDVSAVRFSEQAFGAVYSVSVIEHMAAQVRRHLWPRIGRWLDRKGLLLLTVDLVPSTDQLWDLSEGVQVESPEDHGDLAVIERELAELGFGLDTSEILRDLPDSQVDCALLKFSRS